MRRFARNRGGWPLKKRHIFDAASRRRSDRACDRLHRAIMRLIETMSGDYYDDVQDRGDWPSTRAIGLLNEAMGRVTETDKAAQLAAKQGA